MCNMSGYDGGPTELIFFLRELYEKGIATRPYVGPRKLWCNIHGRPITEATYHKTGEGINDFDISYRCDAKGGVMLSCGVNTVDITDDLEIEDDAS